MLDAELDDSYFSERHKGKCSHCAAGNVVAFGILNQQRRVYILVVDNTQPELLPPIINKRIMPDSIV